jgi:hypothetical protein
MSTSPETLGHPTLKAAMAEVTAAGLKSLCEKGVKALVAVENQHGRWFFLHADDLVHANTLALHWVKVMGGRGASTWPIFQPLRSGKGAYRLSKRPTSMVFEEFGIDYGDEE